jgi:serine/threonine protein kinase
MPVQSPSVRTIFEHALELPEGADRTAYLETACAADSDLRAQVEALLTAHENAGSFLEFPSPEYAPTAAHPAVDEQPGTFVGPYKLLQQIGEGGMGVVFMAEQTHPVQRNVALKIIKPGMDTRQVIARFEAERQALAMMDHPNIARVLDAGTTDAGRPYFVMDLVKGVPITSYCDQHQLTVRDRLEILTRVCHAVQHAHQKGIIHRDLKPSNVLVAEYDGQAVPKIIDFGVAKATEKRLTERTMFTEFGQLIGPFEYMSPEQACFNQLDVDTRTDIYSLGVLFYELMTGSTPFEKGRLDTTPFDETLRIIREEEPPCPSSRLSRTGEPNRSNSARHAGSIASIASNRQSEPARLSRLLRGDLDWIVMKALEKDRGRRYEAASALAADIGHYLADEPVTAGPPSRLYRAGKFVRRNRVPVVAALLVAAAVLAGAAGSAWQAIRATRAERSALAERELARRLAEAERLAKDREAAQRKKAEDLSNFLIGAFQVQYPERDIWALGEVLKRSADELQLAYSDNPGAHAALMAAFGRSYVGLRRFGEAEQMFRKCLSAAADQGLIQWVSYELARCLLRQGKWDEGVGILQEAFLEKLNRHDTANAAELREAWSALPNADAAPRGKPGMDGLDLDGDRDYVILPSVYFDGNPPWALEAIVWPVKIGQSIPVDVSPVDWTSLISATDAGSIGLDTSRGRWAIELYTANIPTGDWTESYAVAAARSEVSLRKWQHVAGVWDGKELRLYVDGELQETRTGADYCTQLSLTPMFLGADPDSLFHFEVAQGYLHGRLRAARISRAVEYTDSFAPPERLESTPGTIGLYDFTIDNGRYAIDRSGHGNHGIIIGAKYANDGIRDSVPVDIESKESE